MTGEQEYRDDYPTKPIGGDNPYHCCLFCGRSVPEINGSLSGHYHWCEWMLTKILIDFGPKCGIIEVQDE